MISSKKLCSRGAGRPMVMRNAAVVALAWLAV